jgi:predicted transcriptional regulator
MDTIQAVKFAGSKTALAKLLQISQPAVSQWGNRVPQARIWQLMLLRPDWFRETPKR